MIILASASPRRKELLKVICSDFEIHPSNIEETIPNNIDNCQVSEYLATQKAKDISKKFPNDVVIGADTVIVFKDKILGKPKNRADAKAMLQAFSNNIHSVITGVCIISPNKSISFSCTSNVEFYNLTDEEIENYLDNDEYKDKAGAYAIQGKASLFIKGIKGDYNNIVGLPISKLNRVLKTFNI